MSSRFSLEAAELFGSRRRTDVRPRRRETSPEFRIAFICTGNICRSAYAEHGLARVLAGTSLEGQVLTASAGTGAVVGAGLETHMARHYTADFATEIPAHTAQVADVRFLAAQDLILVMTREHRQRLLQLDPSLLPRTFLLSEFTTIARTLLLQPLPHDPYAPPTGAAGRLRELVSVAARHRQTGAVAADVPDPYRRSAELYQQVARTLRDELDVLRDILLRASQH